MLERIDGYNVKRGDPHRQDPPEDGQLSSLGGHPVGKIFAWLRTSFGTRVRSREVEAAHWALYCALAYRFNPVVADRVLGADCQNGIPLTLDRLEAAIKAAREMSATMPAEARTAVETRSS